MIRIFLFCFLSALSFWSFAQKDTAFVYTFGGEQDEQGRDIELTSDNGYIMVGATSSFGSGNSDIYLVKVDSNIQFQWSKAIGHFNLEFGHAVKQTNDGGYIICGYSNSYGNGQYDGYLVKTDSAGDVVWDKYFGGFDWDKFYDLEITPDGGFLIVGETHSFGAGDADAWIVKTDSLGKQEWEKFVGGRKKDIAHALISTKDGNYAFCGERNDSIKNQQSMWFVKFDTNSSIIYNKSYNNRENEIAYGITELDNNSLILVGQHKHKDSTQIDESLIMTDKNGDFIKDISVFYGPRDDFLRDVIEGKNGLIFTAGFSNSFGNGANKNLFGIRSISISQNLDLIYGPVIGNGQYTQRAYKIIETTKGDRLIIGTYGSDNNLYTDIGITVFKTDTVAENYELDEKKPFLDISHGKPLNIQKHSISKYSVSPNPAKDYVLISSNSESELNRVEVFDVNGKLLANYKGDMSKIDISKLQHGLLILKIFDDLSSPSIFKLIHE